ncbi:hypothetical protein SAMN05444157_0643 [Frankineae bacterium MT45]|nr:hypothetical protein SAMN05444157_0643 [Frankineae bacterium MT45]
MAAVIAALAQLRKRLAAPLNESRYETWRSQRIEALRASHTLDDALW